jgi:hypothetical protein
MLKISQSLGSSQVKDYYTKEYIAKENYWQQDAEAPGQWHGKLAEDMGLTGAIDYQSFSNLAEGKNAAGDAQLIRHIDRAAYTTQEGTFVQSRGAPRGMGRRVFRAKIRFPHRFGGRR